MRILQWYKRGAAYICVVAAICRQSHESNSLRSDAIYRKLFNNDMQYLIECSEKIVRDTPKS